jgi:DeoR/GlpR family transcriptional regulator of sugar metabolism
MRIQRLQEIVEVVTKEELISFSTLCKKFGASSATIRRDLQTLESQGLIKRVHGGAQAIKSKTNILESPYNKRLTQHIEEKRLIAKLAMQDIHDGDTLFLDSSTTICELATFLAKSNLKIMAITNDIHVGNILQDHPTIELLIIGGLIRSSFYSTQGIFAETMLSQLQADIYFMGVDAIHPQHGACIYHIAELNCKRLMIEHSQKHYVLCDHTKFMKQEGIQICPISSIDKIITDDKLDTDIVKTFKQISNLTLYSA